MIDCADSDLHRLADAIRHNCECYWDSVEFHACPMHDYIREEQAVKRLLYARTMARILTLEESANNADIFTAIYI